MHRALLFLFLVGTLSSRPDGRLISSVKLTGILTHKDLYKKIYPLAKGMIFNEDQHRDGLKEVEHYLQGQGYLSARVLSTFSYLGDKKVAVTLAIEKGPPFLIRNVGCDLFNKLESRLARYLKKRVCTQEILDKHLTMIHDYCLRKGYLFADIQIERTVDYEHHAVDIVFTGSLKHKKEFIFTGNTLFSSQQLYETCAEFGKALLIMPAALLSQEIQELYHAKGYREVKITCHTEPHATIFQIEEGSPARIEKLALHGIEDPLLEKELMRSFAPLEGGLYDELLVQKACRKAVRMLIKRGYGSARFSTVKLEKQESGAYHLVIMMVLGTQITIHRQEAGELKGYIEPLYHKGWVKKYGPLNQELECPVIVDLADLATIRSSFQKNLQQAGYLYTHVDPEFLHDEKGMYLRWRVTGKRNPVTFGPTHIMGICDLPEKYIRQSLAYAEGDTWDTKKIEKTAQRLRSFSIFDHVTLFPESITQEEDAKSVVIHVQESDPFEVRTRIGFQGVGNNFAWQGGATYTCGGTFLWKNMTKRADIGSLKLDITRFLRYITLMYQRPFFSPWPVMVQTKVYSNRYDQPVVLGSREILYRFSQDGFLGAFFQDDQASKWGVTVGMDWMKISDISVRLAEAIDFKTAFIDRYIPYFFGEPSYYVSSIDNRLDPLSGWYLLLSGKALVPFGIKKGAFIKFFVDQGSYIPLYKKKRIVGALRFRMGTIWYHEFSAIIPPERFYLGGAYSLRGYEPDLAPPLNFYMNKDNELIVVPTGGKTMMNTNIELRFSIYRSFGGTLFTDIGLLTKQGVADIRSHDIIGASGFGLRWNTPVGPLRFDIGWKWKRFPGNEAFYNQAAYAWFLTLGNAF